MDKLISDEADVNEFCKQSGITAPNIDITKLWKSLLKNYNIAMLNLQRHDCLLFEGILAINLVYKIEAPVTFPEAAIFVENFKKTLKIKAVEEGLSDACFLVECFIA